MSTQPTPQQQGNTLIFRILPENHPPNWFTERSFLTNHLLRAPDAEAAYDRGSAMPEMARSKEPYSLDKLAEIDTDQLLSVVTYPPEWYLKNVLSATEEAARWARRLWGCEIDVGEGSGKMNIADVEAAQPSPCASLESLPHELFVQICERLTIDTLWSLKRSCRRLSGLVSSLGDVQFALEHAPGVLAILLRTGAAEFWTFRGLKRLMTGKTAHLCQGCVNPGPFVLLLNPLSRKCWACLTQGRIFSDLRLEVMQTREVDNDGFIGIKVIQEEEEEEGQTKDARPPQYRSHKISIKGGPDDPFLRLPLPLEFEAAYTTKGKRKKTSKGEVTIQLPATFTDETLYNVASATPLYRRPYGLTQSEFRAFALFRYMAVWLPYLSPSNQPQGHPGHSSHICWGCLLASRVTEYPDDPELARRPAAWTQLRLGMGQFRKLVYTREEYLQHFRWCRLAQERWEAAVRNRDLRTGELVVPEEYQTEPLEDTESAGW